MLICSFSKIKIFFLSFVTLILFPSIAFSVTSFSYTDFTTAPAFVYSPSASLTNAGLSGTRIKLTDTAAGAGQAAAAWYPTKVVLPANKSFSAGFAFTIPVTSGGTRWSTDPNGIGYTPVASRGGDGLVFVLQNDPRGTNAVGTSGNSLAYYGGSRITQSLGVEFDIFPNTDPQGAGVLPDTTNDSDCRLVNYTAYDHIAIDTNGLNQNTTNCKSGFNFVKNGTWYAWIDYDGTTVELRVSQTDSRPVTADLTYTTNLNTALGNPAGSDAYLGFTAAGQSAKAEIYITALKFISGYAPFTSILTPLVTNPNLSLTFSQSVYDPSNQNLKAIPGNQTIHSANLVNSGGPADANTIKLILNIPSYLSFIAGSLTFTDAVGGSASGLTCCSTVEYSTTASPTYTWTTILPNPTSDIRALRITPSGTINDGSSTAVGFQIQYRTEIQ